MVAGAPFSNVSAASAAFSMQLRRMQLLFTVCLRTQLVMCLEIGGYCSWIGAAVTAAVVLMFIMLCHKACSAASKRFAAPGQTDGMQAAARGVHPLEVSRDLSSSSQI
jgi:hypothetical protein